ncbi:MAG: hypothetical protein ACRDY0_07605, partial [Acidimicrobiales bacterium]
GASVAGAPVPMTATPELGVEAYSAHLVVPAGDTVTVTLHLSGRLSTGGAYRLALRSQPMVNPDVDRVELSRPGGAGGTVDWAPDGGALVSSRVVRFG